jgi:hypothetical protein
VSFNIYAKSLNTKDKFYSLNDGKYEKTQGINSIFEYKKGILL